MNITVNESTGMTPHELHFGEPADNKIREIMKFPEQPQTPRTCRFEEPEKIWCKRQKSARDIKRKRQM